MKRLFVGLLLLMFSMSAQANILELEYEVEVAWLIRGSAYEVVEAPGGDIFEDSYYLPTGIYEVFVVAMSTRVWLFNVFFVGGKIGVLINMIAYNQFDPWWTEYMFEAGLQFGILEIFYEHICSHPQSTDPIFFRAVGVRGEGAHDKLGIRIKGSTR